VDGFSGATGAAALSGARRLSLTTSGRSQAYALTLVLGVLLMAAWLLASPAALPTPILRILR
jgi:NAD(P)H-quinone oxidoreductase subunit 5